MVNKYGPQGTDSRVKKTFEGLNFATWVIKDPTPNKVRKDVKIVTEYNFPINFRGIIVYYAGHGGSYNEKGFFILPCSEDKQQKFLIDSELIAPFQPKNRECCLANRYRLFLFDCCLKEDGNPEAIPTAQTVIKSNPYLSHYQPEVDYTHHYVDSVSITHGSNPRKHIWTYICGQFEQGTNHQNCPCNSGSEATLPSYVGNDYYCESALTNYY